MSVISNRLTDREKAVVETIRMRLTTKQSLAYMKEVGFEISERTLRRDKRKLEEMKLKRLYHIAKLGFQDQHLDRIDNTELFKVNVGKLSLRERSFQTFPDAQRYHYGSAIFEFLL